MEQQGAIGADGYAALSEKEKQTLRLLLDGHDAKSAARSLGLSVHTVNERLRDERRKLSVSSSREAARMLRAREAADPEKLGDTSFGDAPGAAADQSGDLPHPRPARRRLGWAIGGAAVMSLLALALAITLPAQTPPATPAPARVATSDAAPAAEHFLTLADADNWRESYSATGAAFQAANTLDGWTRASQGVRARLGRPVSRTLVDDADVPAPPAGYRLVRFRADYANQRGVKETVALDQEGGAWKVVGVYVE